MTMNKGVDERRLIDSAMTQLRTMTQELGITLFLVSHLTRPKGEAHESGGRIMISQLRGSGALAQLSDMVIGLIKNPDEQDTRELTVLKNRFSGEVGFAGTLKYDRERSRLIDADDAFTKF
jgi:twinkle protein